ncbi:fibronectin type III-like domain-contianing protein [Gaetbulibacter sp. M235]
MQLYIKDKFGIITRPVKKLKGFKKTNLKKGETKTKGFLLLPTI